MGGDPFVIFLMGPTAAGKSALALELARRLPVEIVSVDAAQVYRGMDIGTAKPDRAERAAVPHHLIDVCDPADPYSAARFRDDARRLIDAILGRRRIPLLAGGTMFYFRALERGLSPMPSAQPELRAQLVAEAGRLGWPALHSRLAQLDPERAARIDPNDTQRIQRALEVATASGTPPSRLSCDDAPAARLPWPVVKLAVAPEERATLHRRIELRFRNMLEAGLVEEVEGLWARGDLSLELPSMRSVGYRQVLRYLAGAYDREELALRGIYATRQLAKRQLTWLRTEARLNWFHQSPEEIAGSVMALLEQMQRR